MEKLYAQALWKAIENGATPKSAVESMANILKRQGRTALMPKIARAFARLAEAREATRARVYVAREKDAKHALQASGEKDAEVRVDESLIGGWRLEANGAVTDRSFKKYLLDIYNTAIAA